MTITGARALAGLAVVLGALAPLAGTPYRAPDAPVDIRSLAAVVEQEEDHVTAIELATWIKARKPLLRIIDVRSRAAFDEYHVPNAEHLPLEQAVTAAFRPEETIVLYSQGGAHAAQAWVMLRASGHSRVYFLRGGLDEWLDDVMAPTLASGSSREERQAFERVAEISRYFGGQPRELAPGERGPASAPTPRAAAAARRRGC